MSRLPSKPVLCIDFDGVINSYKSGWREPHIIPDEPNPGAIEALLGYMEDFCVCIHTSRVNRLNGDADAALQNMKALGVWLTKWGFPATLIYTFADYQPEGLRDDMLNIVRTKPPAQVTIDDRGWTFDGTWPTVEQLKAFRPWNRRDVSGKALPLPPAAGECGSCGQDLGRDIHGNCPDGAGAAEKADCHAAAIAADRVIPSSVRVREPLFFSDIAALPRTPFDDAELQRRYLALDLIMRITAERVGVTGDPFATENLEAMARHLEGGGGPPTAGLEGLPALVAEARRHLPGLPPEARLAAARDLMDGYCKVCGDRFTPDGGCRCWTDND